MKIKGGFGFNGQQLAVPVFKHLHHVYIHFPLLIGGGFL